MIEERNIRGKLTSYSVIDVILTINDISVIVATCLVHIVTHKPTVAVYVAVSWVL